MARPQVVVRPVDHQQDEQQQSLVDLWIDNKVESGGSTEAAIRVATMGGLATVLRRPEVTAFLAYADGAAVGYVVLSDWVAGPLIDSRCTAIDQLFVSRDWRRHGVAPPLLAAAPPPPPQVRDANRFFARLGFSPTVVRRVTTPAALARKLAVTGEAPVTSRLGLEEVLHRRRSARFRAVHQGSTAGAVDA